MNTSQTSLSLGGDSGAALPGYLLRLLATPKGRLDKRLHFSRGPLPQTRQEAFRGLVAFRPTLGCRSGI